MDHIIGKLRKAKYSGISNKGYRYWKACCPAHDDNTPSLMVTEADNGALFYCLSGCSQDSILSALQQLGLRPSDLFWDDGWKPQEKPIFDDISRMITVIGRHDVRKCQAEGRQISDKDRADFKKALMLEHMSKRESA